MYKTVSVYLSVNAIYKVRIARKSIYIYTYKTPMF